MGWKDWIPPALAWKASAASRAIVLLTNGQPAWTPRNFEKLAEEGFATNVTVYACVMEIARSASGVPWLLYQRGRSRGQLRELETHPLLTLIEKPNPEQGQAAFFEAMIAFLMLSGNSYTEAVGPSDTAPPMELWNLRPDRTTILPDFQQRVGGFRYKAGAHTQDFPAELVLHQKLFNPIDDWYGLSPLAVAARAVDTDNAAQVWNYALLKNQARPSGALVAKGNLSDEQYATLKADMDERYSGSANAGRPLLLEGDMDWKQLALSPGEMDWLAGRKMSKLEVCQAFGVPPELIGDHEHATYSNFQEARKAFYQETVLPLLDRTRDALNNWLTPKFGERLWLDYDRDDIEALQEERAKVWTSAIEATRAGVLTPNEARAKMGYEPRPEGDVLLVGATMLPLGSAGELPEADPEAAKLAAAIIQTKAFGLGTPEAKAAYWKAVDNAREAWAGKFASKVRALLAGDGNAAAKAVAGSTPEDAAAAAKKAIAERRGTWERELRATYFAVIETFGESTLAGLKSAAGPREVKAFDLTNATIRAWVSAVVARKVTGILETTAERVAQAIADTVEGGGGLDQVADAIREQMDASAGRAQVIARTEVIGAANFGSRAAALQTGLELRKEWIATPGDRTRDTHAALNGTKVAMSEAYPNGLMFPGDPDGAAAEVIQCRCVEGYQAEDDEEEWV